MKLRHFTIILFSAFGASLLTSCTMYNTEIYNPPRRTTSTYTKAPVGGVSTSGSAESFEAIQRPATYSY